MLYIVSIAIDRPVAEDWTDWMGQVHIPDVMQTGCFADAALARDEGSDTDERLGFRVVYRAHSAEALATYQAEHASELQRDHTKRYEGRFDASREILPVLTHFK